MCGLCGIASGGPSPPNPAVVESMLAQIVHRGPDDQGMVCAGRAILAARRLAIIDVAGGHQPVANEDETIWCASNGEIYNFPALASFLRGRGHHLRSRCDTEVIVHLYEELGMAFLDHLDGMFGLAIWNARDDTLILARDRMGIKPLYYAHVNGNLIFGSELKALLPAGIPTEIDPVALDAYFNLSFIPTPYTIFRAARKLPPAHYLRWRPGRPLELTRYWEPPAWDQSQPVPPVEELAEELLFLLRRSIGRHLISDVPLGALLSGGLDSSAVVALMAEQSSQPVETFSVGFHERSFDEAPQARRLASHLGTRHHELILEPDPVSLVTALPWIFDEPFADSSALATYSIAKLARQHVTVALTGDGGDEVFGGYLTYRADKLAQYYRLLPALFRDTILPNAASLLPVSDTKTSLDFKIRRFVGSASLPPAEAHLGWKMIVAADVRRQLLRDASNRDAVAMLMDAHYQAGTAEDRVGQAIHADLCLGLPDDMLTKVDRTTMAVSLEARVPLLDRALVEFMARLPSSTKVHGWTLKSLLKRALAPILPEQTIRQKKAGFNIPVSRWLRHDLRAFAIDTLAPARVRATGLLDERVVDGILHEHLQGAADRGRELWALLTFILWYDRYMAAGKDTG